MCYARSSAALSRLSILWGLAALATLLTAFVSNVWLFTWEPVRLPNSDQSTTITFKIGLWRVCPTVKRGNITQHLPSPACSLIKYSTWDEVKHSDLGVWTTLDFTPAFISRMRLSTPFEAVSVFLMLLATMFAVIGHCNGDHKTLVACGLFILGGLSLGGGLVIFASVLSDAFMDRPRRHQPSLAASTLYSGYNAGGGAFDYRYGWSFFAAGAAFIMAELAALLSITAYLRRFPTVEDMVRVMVPGAERRRFRARLRHPAVGRHHGAHHPHAPAAAQAAAAAPAVGAAAVAAGSRAPAGTRGAVVGGAGGGSGGGHRLFGTPAHPNAFPVRAAAPTAAAALRRGGGGAGGGRGAGSRGRGRDAAPPGRAGRGGRGRVHVVQQLGRHRGQRQRPRPPPARAPAPGQVRHAAARAPRQALRQLLRRARAVRQPARRPARRLEQQRGMTPRLLAVVSRRRHPRAAPGAAPRPDLATGPPRRRDAPLRTRAGDGTRTRSTAAEGIRRHPNAVDGFRRHSDTPVRSQRRPKALEAISQDRDAIVYDFSAYLLQVLW